VRNISSPTAKIDFIAIFMQSVKLSDGDLQAADSVVCMLILALITMGKRASDLLIEIKYINAFSPEELFCVVSEC
jgi:hypothetical protein